MKAKEKISGAEFARRCGISRQAVSKARRERRLLVAGYDEQGRPLYDWPSTYFTVDVNQSFRVGNPGGRPVRRPGRKPVPGRATGRRLPPAGILDDGTSSDWFSRRDLEACWPEIGAAIDAGRLKPAGKFSSGAFAYSFEAAAALVGASFE